MVVALSGDELKMTRLLSRWQTARWPFATKSGSNKETQRVNKKSSSNENSHKIDEERDAAAGTGYNVVT